MRVFNDEEIKAIFPILKYVGDKKFFFSVNCFKDKKKEKSGRCYVETEFSEEKDKFYLVWPKY